MPSTKDKKSKKQLLKIDMSSGSDDDSEHELSYYAKDKVKLMKEVLKLIKPKKIKSMAPDCIKHLDIVEINSMLLEELLGISNKRLQYIFNGENVERETSSSESEEEKPVDVITLDDVSDDDIDLCISPTEKDSRGPGSPKKKKKHKHKVKSEPGNVTVKSENLEKSKKKINEPNKETESLKENESDKLMDVLELLELHARARAIKSQLALEAKKKSEAAQSTAVKHELDSDSDDVIIESPQQKEIIITSDEEENSNSQANSAQITGGNSPIQIADHDPPTEKRQKLAPEQNSKATGVQKVRSHVSKEIEVIDLSDKKAEEADLKNRKQKFLTKVRKIKLKRNKIIVTTGLEVSDNIEQKDKAAEEVVSVSNETKKKTPEKDVEDCEQQLEQINEASGNQVTVEETSGSQSAENEPTIEHSGNEDKPKLSEIQPKKPNLSECDNDEIVINLDEDEMDDMEND